MPWSTSRRIRTNNLFRKSFKIEGVKNRTTFLKQFNPPPLPPAPRPRPGQALTRQQPIYHQEPGSFCLMGRRPAIGKSQLCPLAPIPLASPPLELSPESSLSHCEASGKAVGTFDDKLAEALLECSSISSGPEPATDIGNCTELYDLQT